MRQKFLTCFILIIFSVNTGTLIGQSKIHDFDSLIKNNAEFKILAKRIGDTLDLFNSNDPLEIIFESDFKHLVKNKHKDEYQEAVFKIMYNDSVRVDRKIKIKPRGNMRKSNCFIPPIKLNFPKKQAFIDQLKHFDKLKMVLDCKRSDIYEQYLLSEYYAYKILNIITHYSLRVRLLKVTYIDLGGKFKEITKYAFIIESLDQLNKRLNTLRLDTKGVRDLRTDQKVLTDAYLFQFLIGNTDWSIPGLHNMYILKPIDPTITYPYVVPFDFDYAGIVNTNYAFPDPQLGTESVRERVYRGVCLTSNELYQARERFITLKPAIYALYENDPYLSKSNKNGTIRYINEFYQIIEKDNAFKRNILDVCR